MIYSRELCLSFSSAHWATELWLLYRESGPESWLNGHRLCSKSEIWTADIPKFWICRVPLFCGTMSWYFHQTISSSWKDWQSYGCFPFQPLNTLFTSSKWWGRLCAQGGTPHWPQRGNGLFFSNWKLLPVKTSFSGLHREYMAGVSKGSPRVTSGPRTSVYQGSIVIWHI